MLRYQPGACLVLFMPPLEKTEKTLLILRDIYNASYNRGLVLCLQLNCKRCSFLLIIPLKFEIYDYHTFPLRLVLRTWYYIKRISPIFVILIYLTLINVLILWGEISLGLLYRVGEMAETFSPLYYQWVLRGTKQTSKLSTFSTFFDWCNSASWCSDFSVKYQGKLRLVSLLYSFL